MVKSLFSSFTRAENAPGTLRGRYQMRFIKITGKPNPNTVLVDFSRHSELEQFGHGQLYFQVSIHLRPFHPKQQTTGNSFSAAR